MVDRARRLRRSYEVRQARSQGRSVADGPLVARIRRRPANGELNRWAVVAGKKVGGAVERNRLKRLVREAVRRLDPHLNSGHDIVIVIRGRCDEMPSLAAAEATLTKISRRAGLLNPPNEAETGAPAPAKSPVATRPE